MDLINASVGQERDTAEHLRAAIDWLCRAQDMRDGQADAGGVSAGWSFEDGWLPSYPETSGYIIETFLAAAEVLKRPDLRHRADRIIDWELSIQNADGSFPGHFGEAGCRPVIFNTGQIMHGMIAGYAGLGRDDCLEAAIRAGEWMAGSQDDDGCWRRNVHNGIPHTYNTRAAWALLRVAVVAGEKSLQRAATRNLTWALSQQTPSGWYQSNGFTRNQTPFLHTIAYAIRGLVESGFLLNEERFIASAIKAARALAERQRRDGWLSGAYADNWVPKASYCCLTGLAQMTLIWQRLQQVLGEQALNTPIRRALQYLKRRQRITGTDTPEDGSLAGSFPIWGRYSMFEFPNWATKFFADALMVDFLDITIPAFSSRSPGTHEKAADG